MDMDFAARYASGERPVEPLLRGGKTPENLDFYNWYLSQTPEGQQKLSNWQRQQQEEKGSVLGKLTNFIGSGAPLAMMAGGAGLSALGAGAVAPWGAGEAVSGAYGGAAGTAAEGAGSAAAGTTVGTVAKGTALSRILAGSGTSDDYLQVVGQVGPSLLSAYGSKVQADRYGDLAGRYEGYGAPYRQNLADITNDPSKFYDSPGATKATDAILRRLSIAGNPAGNPYSQALGIDALYKEYGTERDRQAGYGGLTAYSNAAPGLAAGAINAQGSIYGDIGYGIGNVLSPKKTLAQQLAEYKAAGGVI